MYDTYVVRTYYPTRYGIGALAERSASQSASAVAVACGGGVSSREVVYNADLYNHDLCMSYDVRTHHQTQQTPVPLQ